MISIYLPLPLFFIISAITIYFKSYELNNVYTFIIFLLNISLANYLILFLAFLYVFNKYKPVINIFFIQLFFIVVLKNRLRICKNKTTIAKNFNKQTYSLVDGFIQVHPPIFYLSIILFFYILFFCIFVNTPRYILLLFIKFMIILVIAAIFTGGYWSYSQILWGNWWTWDVVELVLVFILILAIFITHRYNISYLPGTLLTLNCAIVVFFLFISVRLGFIESKHNFFNLVNVNSIIIICVYVILFTISPVLLIFIKILYIKLKKSYVNLLDFIFILVFLSLTIIISISKLVGFNLLPYYFLCLCLALFCTQTQNINKINVITFLHVLILFLLLFIYLFKFYIYVVYNNIFYYINKIKYSYFNGCLISSMPQHHNILYTFDSGKLSFEFYTEEGIDKYTFIFSIPTEFYDSYDYTDSYYRSTLIDNQTIDGYAGRSSNTQIKKKKSIKVISIIYFNLIPVFYFFFLFIFLYFFYIFIFLICKYTI